MTPHHVRRMSFDQYYIFTGPDGWAWCEMYLIDGTHVTAPTTFKSNTVAVAELTKLHPGALVDELIFNGDMVDAMRFVES